MLATVRVLSPPQDSLHLMTIKSLLNLRTQQAEEMPKPLILKALSLGLVYASYFLCHEAPVVTLQHVSPKVLDLSLCPMHNKGTVPVAGALPL